MTLLPKRLGTRIGAGLVLLMLSVALATGALVYVAFDRVSDDATAQSQEGLEDLGQRLVMEMAQGQASLTVSRLTDSSRIGHELARYFEDFKAQGGVAPWDTSRLVRGAGGQLYDQDPRRQSDVFVPNYTELDAAALSDIEDSAALDLIFATLFDPYPGFREGEDFYPVAVFFHSVNFIYRYYPPIGIADIVPPDHRRELGLQLAGPQENPERHMVWSEPYIDDAGQGLLITALAPVYEGDTYRGRIGVDLSLNRLVEKLNATRPSPAGFAFYVDRTGALLETDSTALIAQNLATEPEGPLAAALASMASEASGVQRVDIDGEPHFVAHASLEPVGGSFAVAAPVSEITAQAAAITAAIDAGANQTVMVVLAVIGGVFALGLVSASWLNRRLISQPIATLVAGTRAVAGGDLDHDIPVRGEHEMAELATAFNQMTAELRQQRDALRIEVQEREAVQDELRGLFAAMTDVVLVIDRDGRYLRIPSTGAPGSLQPPEPEQLLGKTMHEVMPEALAGFFLSKIRTAIEQSTTQTFEYSMEVDGRETWFSAAVSPVAPDAAVVVARDITSIKQTEQALRCAQERQLAMVNSVDAILWEASADFSKGFTFVSEQAERLLGYPAERWLGEPSFWSDHIYEEDRNWCVNLCLTETAAGRDHDFEYRMIAADGRIVWLRDIVTVVMEDGKPEGLRGVMIDITELKAAVAGIAQRESQYRSIFESTSDGLVINDLETGVILSANPAFCRMHGYDDMTGMHPTVHIHPSSHYLFQEYVDTVRAGGEFRCRARDLHRDGIVFDVEVIGRGLTYQERPAVLGVVRDVTEQVRSEQVLEQRVADRTGELESLLNLARATSSTLDLDPLVRLILEDLREVVEFKSALLVLADEHQQWVVRDVIPPPGSAGGVELHQRLQEWPRQAAPFLRSEFERLERGEAVLIPDILAPLEAADATLRESVAAFGRSWMAVPLILKDQLAGYISLSSDDRSHFDEKHVRLARAFADQATLAIENARLYEQAQVTAAVQERQRLARDLHDSVAQVLYGIALGAKTARTYLEHDPDSSTDAIDYVSSLAAAGLAEMRALIFDLHPESIEREGLVNAIQRQVAALEARHGVAVDWSPCAEPDVSFEVKEAVYAIVREAAHNVVKHARATHVRIALTLDDHALRFEVEDDGIGFDTGATISGHFGLHSMGERAAKLGGVLHVTSDPDRRKTVVSGSVPCIPRS